MAKPFFSIVKRIHVWQINSEIMYGKITTTIIIKTRNGGWAAVLP
jgi:hypothetical protein